MANDSEREEALDFQSRLELVRIELEESKLALEQSRLALERQHEYLARWNIDLHRPRARAIEAYKSAVGFAQSGLRSAILMNGGALIALPTFADVLNLKDGALIILPMIAFALGIVSAVTAILFAYLASNSSILGLDAEASGIAIKLNMERAEGDPLEDLKTQAATSKKDIEDAAATVNNYSSYGLWAGIGSLLAFVAGSALTAGLALQ